MLKSKSFLAIDLGASTLKVGEFQLNEGGGLLLLQYGFKSLGPEGLQEATREAAIVNALQELLAEKSFAARTASLCAPGYHTFSKFIKLPPVDTSKVTQIIEFEARQNVPFPLEEVVWDYQILGAAPSGELEVLLVAIKREIVEGLVRAIENVGVRVQMVDVSTAALCNAFRYNYPEVEPSSLLLDIGAKTSNLLFFEKGNVYARGINIGANAITADFSKESRLAFADAEQFKVSEGFVSLGGAYEEPDNPQQAAISKIARQVLTRLHIQVNQTIQFYRGQQGGTMPQQLFLSGGASIMPYTAQFFCEKLNFSEAAVVYFNPLKNVQIDPSLNLEDLARGAHSLGEVVGVALRNLAHCPIELNLMPTSSRKRQELSAKKPYFAAALASLVLIVFAWGWFFDRSADAKAEALKKLMEHLGPVIRADPEMKSAMNDLKVASREADQFAEWVDDRFYWVRLLSTLRGSFISVEDKMEKELGAPVGLWVDRFKPIVPGADPMGGPGGAGLNPNPDPNAAFGGAPPAPPLRGPRDRGGRGGFGGPRGFGGPGGLGRGDATNHIQHILLSCRGVNRKTPEKPNANILLAQAVLDQLRSHPDWFDTNETRLVGQLGVLDAEELTFSFEVSVKLNRTIAY